MATNTVNFGLELPEDEDFYSIHVQNGNMNKIDVALQENKQNLMNHENKQDEHLTAEQTEKIESAIQPLENFTSGNFVKINPDGTFSDSGLNADSFENSDHNEKSVYSENGVHNLRYHNEKFQIFNGNEWVDVTEKSFIQVKVNVETGAIVNATDGVNTVSAESVNGFCIIPISNYGTWNFTATVGDKTTNPVSLVIDTVKWYEIDLATFSAEIRTTYSSTYSPSGIGYAKGNVVCKHLESGTIFTDTYATSTHYSNFYVNKKGTYEISVTWNTESSLGWITKAKTFIIDVNEDSKLYEIKYAFPYKDYELLYLPNGDLTVTFTDTTDESITFSYTKLQSDRRNETYDRLICWLPDASKTYNVVVTDTNNIPLWVGRTDVVDDSNKYGQLKQNTNIYSAYIAQNDSDPNSRVVYKYMASSMTGGSADWDNTDIFSQIEPYVLAPKVTNGTQKIQKNDYTLLEDGRKITDVYSYNQYDVVIKFPDLYYRIDYTDSNLKFYVSTKPFTNSKKWNSRYIGAYLAYTAQDNCVYSHSSKSPTDNQSLNTQKQQLANRNDNKYRLFNYDDLLMLQMLFILRYKNTDSELALGRGFVSGESKAFTGRLNQKGMYSGSSTSGASMDGIKFCGLEDFWGNIYCYIDGLTVSSDKTLKINGISQGTVPSSINTWFKTSHSKEFPFIQKDNTSGGSSSTYFCDYQQMTAPASGENIACFGSIFNGGYGMGGLFSLWMDRTADTMPSGGRGARLVYQP